METPDLPAIDSDEIRAMCQSTRNAAAHLTEVVTAARAAIGQDGYAALATAAYAAWNDYRRAGRALVHGLTGHDSPSGILTA